MCQFKRGQVVSGDGVVAVFEGGSRYQQTHGVAEKQGPGETSLTKGFDPFVGIEMLRDAKKP